MELQPVDIKDSVFTILSDDISKKYSYFLIRHIEDEMIAPILRIVEDELLRSTWRYLKNIFIEHTHYSIDLDWRPE